MTPHPSSRQGEATSHRRRGPRKEHRHAWIPLGVILLSAWATFPLGSAEQLPSALLIAGCYLLACAHLATAGQAAARPFSLRLLPAALIALLAWVFLQLVPLPSSVFRGLHPLLALNYGDVLDGPCRLSLAVNRSRTLHTLTLWLAYAAIAWVCCRRCHTRAAARTVAYGLAIAGTLQACLALIDRSVAAPSSDFLRQRLVGSFTGSNALGGYLSLTLISTLGFLLEQLHRLQQSTQRGGRRRDLSTWLQKVARPLLLTIALMAQGTALILSGSRGAMVATGLATCALLIAYGLNTHRFRGRTGWLLGGGLVLLLVFLAGHGVLTAGSARLSTSALPSDIAVRLAIWKSTGQLFLHHPLGVGPGGYADAFQRFQPPGFGDSRVYQAHNDWLQALAELGLPGFMLLVLVLLALARSLLPLLRGHADSSRIWFERGLLLALGAALLHALVDFNLSSRPGVALTAVVILGTLLGAAAQRAAERSARDDADATPAERPLRRVPRGLQAAAALAALLLVARDVRLAVAARRVDNAFVAAGGIALPGTWPRLPGGNPAHAWTQATRAVTHAPADSQIRYRHVQNGILAFETQRETLVASPPQAGLTPVQWRRAVHLAMRQDEVRACRELAPWIDQAVSQSPWNADARALQARVRLVLEPAGTERPFMAHDLAAQLAPHDPAVLQRLCASAADALAAAPRSDLAREAATRLRMWSRQVCALPAVGPHEVMAAWELAGWPLNALVDRPDASIDCLYGLYVRFNHIENGPLAHRTITRLAQRLHSPATWPPSFGSGGATQKDALTRRVNRELTKWTLRAGHWQGYRDQARSRQDACQDTLRDQLSDLPPDNASPTLRRLALEKIDGHTGLDATWRLRLAQLESDHGDANRADDLLATIALSPAPLPPGAAAHTAPASPTATVGQQLLAIRLASDAGRHADASRELEALLDAGAVPYRFAHQARVALAANLLALGERDRARTMLQSEAAGQPAAVAPLLILLREFGPGTTAQREGQPRRITDLLPAVMPPYRLDTTFLGGSVTLLGIDLQRQFTTPNRPPTTRLRLLWTFTHRLPADLAVNVRLQRRKGKTAWSRTQTFDSAARLTFGAGQPVMGLVIPVEFMLPDSAHPTHRLRIQLTTASGGTVFPTDEGLSAIELNSWSRDMLAAPQAPLTNILTRLEAQDADSALEFAPFGLESSITKCLPNSRIVISAASPSGLASGVARATTGAPGSRLLLPDPRFSIARPTTATDPAPPAWSIEAPAFAWRMIGRSPREHLEAFCTAQHLTTRTVLRGGDFSHNIHYIFNPARYYDTHPNWYPLVGDHRPCPTNQDWQVCLSAPDIVAHAAQAARTHFENRPESAMFALGINDSARWCECDACRDLCPPEEQEFPASERWWSEPYWRFVNAVATEVARTHPERRLGAIAYGAVVEPPTFSLHTNVMVFVCQEGSNRFDPGVRETDDARLETWRTRARHLGRYDYPGLATWVFPRYGIHGVVDGMRVAANLGVSAYYVEDHTLPWLDGGQSWILAQALWNPRQSVDALEARFCELAFGPAAAIMRRYHERLRALWESAPHATWLGGFKDMAFQARRCPSEAITELLEILLAADRACNGMPEIAARIAAIRDPLELSLDVAREWDAARDASRLPDSPAELAPARTRVQRLTDATQRRRERLHQAQGQPWGAIMAQTPAWQQAWARWDAQMADQGHATTRFLDAVEQAAGDLIPGGNPL